VGRHLDGQPDAIVFELFEVGLHSTMMPAAGLGGAGGHLTLVASGKVRHSPGTAAKAL
jgi:hypothetical protein